MIYFFQKHKAALIAVGLIIAAASIYYHYNMQQDTVEIQSTTAGVQCLNQPCGKAAGAIPCSQCNKTIPITCDKKTSKYRYWQFGDVACNT